MSKQVDLIFKPVFFLTSIFFLHNFKICKNQYGGLYILTSIRIIFLIIIGYITSKRSSPSNDAVDIAVQLMQKLSYSLTIFLTYITANITSKHLNNLKTLVKQNNKWNYTHWTLKNTILNKTYYSNTKIRFIFIPIYTFYLLLNLWLIYWDYSVFSGSSWYYFSFDEFILLIFSNFTNALYMSIICSIASLILQQYHQLNKELTNLSTKQNTLKKFNKSSKIYTNLHKQYKLFSAAFKFFILGKFLSTYTWLTITLDNMVRAPGELTLFSVFWIVFLTCELMIIAYYCHRILKQVIY